MPLQALVSSFLRACAALAVLCALAAPAAFAAAQPPSDSADTRPRLLVLTDIGGDPDDRQSLIRLLLYANELAIEGLVASAAGVPGELRADAVKPELIREIVEAYALVQPNLALHDPRYPPAEPLRARIKTGNPHRGVARLGEGNDTEGSRWIIAAADRPDPRPLCIAIWGGSTELAQALWRVRNDRTEAQAKAFRAKLRVYAVSHQDDTGPWIVAQFPDLFYVLGKESDGRDRREAVFRGMYLGGREELTSRAWVDAHVRTNHGPLGALYPTGTWTAPNPHSALKEGDTPSWFYFLENGLSDAAHPDWGSWGGRFRREAAGPWHDAGDTVDGTTDARATVWRWRPAFQAELQARMDWCVLPPQAANHAPRPVLNGDATRRALALAAALGSTVTLDAAGSEDPEGTAISFRWWVYGEAGTYARPVTLGGAAGATATLVVPADAGGTTIHVILQATDGGSPPLTSYRRAVITVDRP